MPNAITGLIDSVPLPDYAGPKCILGGVALMFGRYSIDNDILSKTMMATGILALSVGSILTARPIFERLVEAEEEHATYHVPRLEEGRSEQDALIATSR